MISLNLILTIAMSLHKAELYSVNNFEQTAAVKKFFDIYGEKLRDEFGLKKVSIIDIGTGCGTVLSEVVVKNCGLNIAKVMGVDISLEMIKFSRERYGSELMEFNYMDAGGDIPEYLKDIKFDVATSFYSHHFIKDLKKGFKNVYELLNPGGMFCCVFLAWHLVVDIFQSLEKKYYPYTKVWKENSPLWFCENVDEIVKNHLIENGFEIVEFLDSKNEIYDYGTIQNFSNAMRAVALSLKNMPENLQDEYMDDVMESLFSMQKSNPAHIPRRLLYFIAKK